MALHSAIGRLNSDQEKVYSTLYKSLELLTDLKYVYTQADTTEKQELVRLGFGGNLYYQNGIYRTPTMIKELSHNYLKMKEKGLLICEKKKEGLLSENPLSGLGGPALEPLIPLLTFLDGLAI